MLDYISFRVEPGEFVALLGLSGCGKSSLLRLVARQEPASAGRLLVDGVPITGPDPSRVVVFQDPTLYPWRTVWANAALGLEARHLLRGSASGWTRRWNWSACLDLLARFRTSFPAAWRNGHPWRGRW